MIPVRVRIKGDNATGAEFIGAGMDLILSLKNDMEFQSLSVGEKRLNYSNGIRIIARISHNVGSVTIDVSYIAVQALIQEDRETIICKDTLELDPNNPTTILSNSSETFAIINPEGKEYEVTLTGGGFFLDAGLTETTKVFSSTDTFTIFTGDTCGSCDISVADICFETGETISGEYVELVYDSVGSADIIADNSQGTCFFTGGVGPFTVTIEGSGFWLDAAKSTKTVVISARDFTVFTAVSCGSGKFTITDSCGVQISGAVRSVTGEWNDNCYGLIVDYQNNTPSTFSGYPVDNSQICKGPQTYGSYRSSWQRISVVAVKRWSSWTSSWYYSEYSDPRNKIVAELDAALLNVTCPIGIYNDPGVENIPLSDPTGAANTCDPANPCEWIC